MSTRIKILDIIATSLTAFAFLWLIVSLANKSDRRITALETRMTLVESNSVETLAAAQKVQADLGRLSEAVLRWRMSVETGYLTNRVSVLTNAAPAP